MTPGWQKTFVLSVMWSVDLVTVSIYDRPVGGSFFLTRLYRAEFQMPIFLFSCAHRIDVRSRFGLVSLSAAVFVDSQQYWFYPVSVIVNIQT
jgi:hypothetical protein